MLKQAENTVKIEGILSEVDLKLDTYTKDGASVECIRGTVKIRVEEIINGEPTTLEVPVRVFTNKITKAGKQNPSYESMSRALEFTSIAAAGNEDEADKVRITGANIGMNEWWIDENNLGSHPVIRGSFIQKVKAEEFKPSATFITEFVVGNKRFEVDSEGVETGAYLIKGIVPRYGGLVDIVPFKVTNTSAIDAMEQYWTEGSTVKALGKINFSSTVVTEEVAVDFGDPIEKSRTISVSELLITGGSSVPLEGDFAFDPEEVQGALNERTARLEVQKEKDLKRKAEKNIPTAPAKGTSFVDAGF